MAAALPVVAFSQVTFAFNFNDDVGVGFNDATFGAERRGALQSASAMLGSYFTGYAPRTVTLDVTSVSNGSGMLASAGSPAFVVANSFQPNLVTQYIQTGNTNGQTSFGDVLWNFGHSWDYDDDIGGGTFDFKAVAIHELLHATGFSSFIGVDGSGLGGGSSTTWSTFDQFLTDAAGNRLVSAGGVYQGGTILTDGFGSAGGNAGDVFFSGTNAMLANGGLRVPIYSPATFLSGSSLSHLDTEFFQDDYVMLHAVAAGPAMRTLSAIELGILTDLGYNVSAIPEPSTYAAILGALALGLTASMRRRRG